MAAPRTQDTLIQLRPEDNVAITTAPLKAGATLQGEEGTCNIADDIPPGHKVAMRPIKKGDSVLKYGQVIGVATQDIQTGDWVHSHNLEVGERVKEYRYATRHKEIELYPADRIRTFEGFRRPDGRVGTRNYVGIISTVNCSAHTSRAIADGFKGIEKHYPNVDGVFAITHKTGCGMAHSGEEHNYLQRTLAGHMDHPNVAGCVVIGLGCEVNQPGELIHVEGLTLPGSTPPPILSIQTSGGVLKTIERGKEAVAKILPEANNCTRTPIPVSELLVGTECGGSDAHSGITANPALGWACDELIRSGGTAILAETTEMYGAEHLLIERARDVSVGKKLEERIHWWEHYTEIHGACIDNNPSPGNKAGGLTTIFEKSLGAIAKGGTTNLNAVYEYAERVREKGFVIMDTPGYDPVSVTGMVAGGANIIVFTTGRGSALGCIPTPSIKVATNSAMYRSMTEDMDLNAGEILEGVSMEDMGRAIFEEIIAVASGKKTKSEQLGIGEEEFAPWALGPVL